MITDTDLQALGFLPAWDDEPNGDWSWSIWDKTDAELDPEHDEDQPHHCLTYNTVEQTLWLEAYDSGGQSLAITELPSHDVAKIQALLALLTH